MTISTKRGLNMKRRRFDDNVDGEWKGKREVRERAHGMSPYPHTQMGKTTKTLMMEMQQTAREVCVH